MRSRVNLIITLYVLGRATYSSIDFYGSFELENTRDALSGWLCECYISSQDLIKRCRSKKNLQLCLRVLSFLLSLSLS